MATYWLATILVDGAIGILAASTVFVIALSFGGFSFFAPWLLAATAVNFGMGLVRSQSAGILWQKCVVLCLAQLMINVWLSRPVLLSCAIAAMGVLLPCAAGIWVRRRGLDWRR